MEFIFIFFQKSITTLALNEVWVWVSAFGAVCLWFLANLVINPYRKHNKVLKKTNVYLKHCVCTKSLPNAGKVVLPGELGESFQNYLNSHDKFPGEVIKFAKQKAKPKFGFVPVMANSFCFVVLCGRVVYTFAPFLILTISLALQLSLMALADMRHRHGSKMTLQTTRLLDKLFGQSKTITKQAEIADVCIDKEVDDVIEKINFFKQNGINEQTAKEVANLLSHDKLNKIRTQEQQKRLNLALNGLLQVMSKNQQEKQIG